MEKQNANFRIQNWNKKESLASMETTVFHHEIKFKIGTISLLLYLYVAVNKLFYESGKQTILRIELLKFNSKKKERNEKKS